MGHATSLQETTPPQRVAPARVAKTTNPTPAATAAPMVALQRSLGNRAVERLVRAKLNFARPSDRFEREADGVCPPAADTMQLAIEQPAEKYRQEALAEEAPITPEPRLQRACDCSGRCPKCQAEQTGQDREAVPTRRARSSGLAGAPALGTVVVTRFAADQPRATASPILFEPAPGHDSDRVRVEDHLPRSMQAKLSVGQRGDIYEQEADKVADDVVRMPPPVEGRRPAVPTAATLHSWAPGIKQVRRQPTDLDFEIPEEEEELVQAKAVPGQPPDLAPPLEGDLDALNGRGQAFPPSLRAFFEPRFGYDLSPVRVHADERAHRMARAVHARAFTLGRHIVFAEGRYAPTTSEGQHLLAHELTHTIQQGAVTQALATSDRSAAAPRAGSEAAEPAVRVPSTAPFMLQRADCNFYVFDSTEPTALGTSWKWAAVGLAAKAYGGYAVPSGDTIEEMLHTVLSVYATKDCDCLEEIQFLSHGSSGNAMFISKTGEELTINDFNIPELEKYGDGPRNMPGYQEWHAKLTYRQRRLVLLRRILCGPGAEVYYRSCSAFQGKAGQEFARASARFWRSKVIGHTKIIGVTQPGRKVIRPGQEPDWPESEGTETPTPKKPVGVGAGQKPKKD